MKNKRIIVSLVLIVMMVISMIAPTTFQANAYSFKKKTKIVLRAYGIDETQATLQWSKIKKCNSGYAVFRNGKAIRHLGKNQTRLFDYGIKDGTLHKYQIKTYKAKKQKQYYNKKTGKWTKKKPKKKHIGGTRKITIYKYSNASNVVYVYTPAIKPLNIIIPMLPLECTYGMQDEVWDAYTIDNITFKKEYYTSSKTYSCLITISGTMEWSKYGDSGFCSSKYTLTNSAGNVVASGRLISDETTLGDRFSYEQLFAPPLSPGTYILKIEKDTTL